MSTIKYRIDDIEGIDKYIHTLTETIMGESEYVPNFPNSKNLTEALTMAEQATENLSQIGASKLTEIKLALPEETIAPEVVNMGYTAKGVSLLEELDRDKIFCASKILQTYQTLLKYQEKIEELNKVRQLEKILGE